MRQLDQPREPRLDGHGIEEPLGPAFLARHWAFSQEPAFRPSPTPAMGLAVAPTAGPRMNANALSLGRTQLLSTRQPMYHFVPPSAIYLPQNQNTMGASQP
jgi:hypothetical protein